MLYGICETTNFHWGGRRDVLQFKTVTPLVAPQEEFAFKRVSDDFSYPTSLDLSRDPNAGRKKGRPPTATSK